MNRLLLTLFILMVIGNVNAQTMIPLPAHNNIYSSAVRGYWFTAPLTFRIIGLRVSPDAGTGTQNIHLMKINDPVPVVFSASSTNFTTLAYINNAPNGVIQPVNITVNTGDIIGVLGTAGTANSYSPFGTPFAATIGAFPITLNRLLYQGNITTGPAPNYSTEGSGSQISRVEIYYDITPPCPVAPSGITITAQNSTSVSFNWTAVPGSVGYDYIVTTNSVAPATGYTNTLATSATANGLTPSTTYYIHVRNYCAVNQTSAWTSKSFVTNDACVKAINFSVPYVDSNNATIAWAGTATATSYRYLVDKIRSNPTSNTGSVATASANASLTGLTDGTWYYVHIKTYCPGNDSSDWYLDSFYTPVPCRRPILSQTFLSANNSVTSWAPVNTAVGYEYYFGPVSTIPANGTPTKLTNVQTPYLQPSSSYTISVRSMCVDNKVNSNSLWASLDFVTNPALAINNIKEDGALAIYPNPVKNMLNVMVAMHNGVYAGTIVLQDISGKLLKTQIVNSNITQINVATLPAGVYTVKYTNDGQSTILKFSKE